MLSRVRLRLQSLVLLTLIPSLLLVTVVVAALIYRTLHAIVLEGFDRKLSAISSVTGAFIDGEEHAQILQAKNEESRSYKRYVRPMQAIRQRKELTFIYTQVLGEGAEIAYVLDGQTGDDHSAIGDKDELPDGEVGGAREVIRSGKVHLSDIRVWEQWGLLKSGFAPIYDRRGRVVAMAGADVDISTIRHKTSAALAQVGITSVIALLIAGFLSVAIARGLTRPIAEVNEAALQVAAGEYGHRIDVSKPRELAELATAFSAMSGTLAASIQGARDTHRELESRRRRSELRRVLTGWAGEPLDGLAAAVPDELSTEGQRGDAPPTCTGSVTSDDGSLSLSWRGAPDSDPLRASRVHAEVAVIGKRLLECYRENPDLLIARLEHLYINEVAGFVLRDARSGTVRTIARRPTPAAVMIGQRGVRAPDHPEAAIVTERKG